MPHAGDDAKRVSLALGVVNLLVSSRPGLEAGLEIVGNPSIAPPRGLGVVVDERHAFLPSKLGWSVPQTSWPSRPLAVFPRGVPD